MKLDTLQHLNNRHLVLSTISSPAEEMSSGATMFKKVVLLFCGYGTKKSCISALGETKLTLLFSDHSCLTDLLLGSWSLWLRPTERIDKTHSAGESGSSPESLRSSI